MAFERVSILPAVRPRDAWLLVSRLKDVLALLEGSFYQAFLSIYIIVSVIPCPL